MRPSTPIRAVALATCALTIPAQTFCDDRGTSPRTARIEAGPPLRCAGAPDAPAFVLLTPPFAEIVARPGWRLVSARRLPRFLVRYRCTGLWLWPVVPAEILIWGDVLDVTAEPCPPSQGGTSNRASPSEARRARRDASGG